jgi:hypothetical protein
MVWEPYHEAIALAFILGPLVLGVMVAASTVPLMSRWTRRNEGTVTSTADEPGDHHDDRSRSAAEPAISRRRRAA